MRIVAFALMASAQIIGSAIFSSACNAQAVPPARPAATSPFPVSQKTEGRYAGPWVTTKNKKLDGTTNCEIKQLTPEKWQGRFWGEWQKVPFDYTVEFERVKNPPERLETAQTKTTKNVAAQKEPGGIPVAGKAMIDGAPYEWVGSLSREQFEIEFTGERYEGHLELTRVPQKKPAP